MNRISTGGVVVRSRHRSADYFGCGLTVGVAGTAGFTTGVPGTTTGATPAAPAAGAFRTIMISSVSGATSPPIIRSIELVLMASLPTIVTI